MPFTYLLFDSLAVDAGIQDCFVSLCHCLVFFFSSYTEHEHHLCSGSQATHTDSHFIIFISVVVVAVAIAVAVVVVVAFGLC